MKTIYLVKKDPEVHGNKDNWIIMNSYEFAMFMKTEEGKRRRANFGEMEAVDEYDYKIVMECDSETAKEIKKEGNHSKYLRKQEIESGYTVFLPVLFLSEKDKQDHPEVLQALEPA